VTDAAASPTERAAALNAQFPGTLHELLGMVVDSIEPGRVVGRLTVRPEQYAVNGFFHAANYVALADSLCGFGTMATLPDGAAGFTTAELKTNFLGTVGDGEIRGVATMMHGGRTTQVWDAEVHAVAADGTDGRRLALFRCTQVVLYPR